MAIALRGNSYSGTSTCNKPSGVVSGDLMLAWIYCDGNGSSNTGPSGWTLSERISSTGGYTQELWYKLAGGSEPSSYTWTYSGSGAGDNISIDAFSGNTLSVDKHASAYSTTAGTTIEAPAITPTASGECCVTFAIMYSGTGTQPTGYTQACDALSVSDGIPSAYETGQGIGAVQPNWGTGSANWGCATILIAEGGGGGTTHHLAATIGPLAGLSASLTVGKPLHATIGPLAGLSAALTVTKPLAASIGPLAGLSASLVASKSLHATIGPLAGLSASLVASKSLHATIGPLVGLSASLTVGKPLAATIGPLYGMYASLTAGSQPAVLPIEYFPHRHFGRIVG